MRSFEFLFFTNREEAWATVYHSGAPYCMRQLKVRLNDTVPVKDD